MSRSLSLLSDAQGTVTFGFLAADVYYLRIAGYLSAKIGIDCGLQLRGQLTTPVTLFIDVASEGGSAFAARSAVMRALLANRRHLNAITMLIGIGTTAARARALIGVLDRPHQLIESAALFQAQLLEAVPAARSKAAPPSGTQRVARSVRPTARSARPRTRVA